MKQISHFSTEILITSAARTITYLWFQKLPWPKRAASSMVTSLSRTVLVQRFVGEGAWSSAFTSSWAIFEELYLLLQALCQIYVISVAPASCWTSPFTLSLIGIVFKSILHISILASVSRGIWSLLVFMYLEGVIERTCPPADLWVGESEASYTLPCTWNLHSAYYSHTNSHFKDAVLRE